MHRLWFCKHQHYNQIRFKLSVACQRWWFHWRFWFIPSVPGYFREEEEHKPEPWRNPIERNHMGFHLENEVAVVKTPTIILNNPVILREDSGSQFLQNRHILARLHKVTSKKTVMFIIVFVRTSYFTQHFNIRAMHILWYILWHFPLLVLAEIPGILCTWRIDRTAVWHATSMWKCDKQFNLSLRHIYVTHLVGKATSNAFNETWTRSRDGIQFKTWVTHYGALGGDTDITLPYITKWNMGLRLGRQNFASQGTSALDVPRQTGMATVPK